MLQIYVKQEKTFNKNKDEQSSAALYIIPRRRLNVALTTTSSQERDIHVNYLSLDFYIYRDYTIFHHIEKGGEILCNYVECFGLYGKP